MIYSYLTLFPVLMSAYFVGSLPSGYWLARWYGITDIRAHGSGNSGATNVSRVMGFWSFFVVFFADAGKAWAYLMLLTVFSHDSVTVLLAANNLLVGNVYSAFMGGAGGKGVATFIGILLALYPGIACASVVTWLLALAVTRVVGIASVVAVLAVPWYAQGSVKSVELGVLIVMALLIAWRHRENIRRYYRGLSYEI